MADLPACDLVVTMDDATGLIYLAILVAEERIALSIAGLLEVLTTHGLWSNPLRAHYGRATVRVWRYADGGHGVFHGPRCIGLYDAAGQVLWHPQQDGNAAALHRAV